jgi:hypothetical protein
MKRRQTKEKELEVTNKLRNRDRLTETNAAEIRVR